MIIENCKELLSRPWVVEVRQILREANRAADWIAKWVMRLGVQEFELMLTLGDKGNILGDDELGVQFPRSRTRIGIV